MIKTQIIEENESPIAVILDYKEYIRLKNLDEDMKDYNTALEIKQNNKKWTSHESQATIYFSIAGVIYG